MVNKALQASAEFAFCSIPDALGPRCLSTNVKRLRTMRIRQHIVSLLPVVGLGLLLLLPPGGRAADEEGRPQPKASFGDVIERQLPAPSYVVAQQVLLDLDNGELLPMPTNIWKMSSGFNPRPSYDWMRKHGADLQVDRSAHSYPSTNLCFHLDDGWVALLGRDVTFETIAASDVNPELARAGVFQHLDVPKPTEGPGATLVFKTREGGVGVMQLLEFSAKPEPILKLRYKLVRTQHRVSKPSAGEPKSP